MISDNISLDASAAELLALAVSALFPAAQLLRAGSDGFGFYYDLFIEQPLSIELASLIEEHMRGSVKACIEFKTSDMMRENAAGLFEHRGQHIKAELALLSPLNIIEVIAIGKFVDLPFAVCLPSMPREAVIKILDISPRPFYLDSIGQITAMRIYATVAMDKKIVKGRTKLFEAVKNRHHRHLGEAMQLFTVNEDIGNLGVQWLPKGVAVRDQFSAYWHKALACQGFQFTRSPPFNDVAALNKKNESLPLLPEMEYEELNYVYAPLVTKHHAEYFSKGDFIEEALPIRLAELDDLIHDIPLDQLTDLFVSRSFAADKAHIFCSPEQVPAELISSLQFILKITKIIEAECYWILTSSPPKAREVSGQWNKAFHWTVEALQACGISYQLDASDKGSDTSLLEVYFKDSLGRMWRGPRLGFNFQVSIQHRLGYRKRDGSRHMPVVIECSYLGSIERLLAILLEHRDGWLPLTFAPEQFRIIPVGEEHMDYAKGILQALTMRGYRVTMDCCPQGSKTGSLAARINAAERARVPYAFIVGEQEFQAGTVSVCSLSDVHLAAQADDTVGKIHPPRGGSKGAFSGKCQPSGTECTWESFLQRLQDEGHLIVG